MDNTNTTQTNTAKLPYKNIFIRKAASLLLSRGLVVGQNLLLAYVLRYQWSMLA